MPQRQHQQHGAAGTPMGTPTSAGSCVGSRSPAYLTYRRSISSPNAFFSSFLRLGQKAPAEAGCNAVVQRGPVTVWNKAAGHAVHRARGTPQGSRPTPPVVRVAQLIDPHALPLQQRPGEPCHQARQGAAPAARRHRGPGSSGGQWPLGLPGHKAGYWRRGTKLTAGRWAGRAQSVRLAGGRQRRRCKL